MHASLDQAQGMVSFVENPEHYDSLPMVHHMETQLQQCVALQRKLASLDKQLALDPRYMHKVSRIMHGTGIMHGMGVEDSEVFTMSCM